MFQKKYKTGSSNIIISDYPDPDVIRVDDTYYMVSTTMHYMPGCVILRSYNLLDWEFCSYVYNKLDSTSAQKLEDQKGIYGKGMWAASLRYHNDYFFVSFVCNDTHKTYLYKSKSITGPWEKHEVKGFFHDMSVLFDDGKVYVVSGNTDIYLTEMNEDFSGPKEHGLNKIIIQDNRDKITLGYEGSHFYKINNKYYIFLIHILKNGMRSQDCFVSENIEGPYIGKQVLNSDLGNWNSGVAQGGIVQSNDGKWYGISFQDHGALGRIPVLVPVSFINDFPVFGVEGEVPSHVTVLDNKPDYNYAPLYANNFCSNENVLLPAWQWNHEPDLNFVQLHKNTFKIKTAKTCINLTQTQNTLTQRTLGELCSGSVYVDASLINDGDFTGLCALEGEYAFIGFTKESGKFYIVTACHKIPYSQWAMNVFDDRAPDIISKKEVDVPFGKFKLKFDLTCSKQQVELMLYNDKAGVFETIGEPVKLRYTLDQFVGVRFGLFVYSTINCGGEVTFKDFIFDN